MRLRELLVDLAPQTGVEAPGPDEVGSGRSRGVTRKGTVGLALAQRAMRISRARLEAILLHGYNGRRDRQAESLTSNPLALSSTL